MLARFGTKVDLVFPVFHLKLVMDFLSSKLKGPWTSETSNKKTAFYMFFFTTNKWQIVHLPRKKTIQTSYFFSIMVPHEVLLLHGCFLILRVAAPWFLEHGFFLCVAPGKMWKLLGWFSSKMIYIDPLETEKGSSFSAWFLWDCTLGWAVQVGQVGWQLLTG